MNQPHKYKDAIIAWANGEQIEYRIPELSMNWKPIESATWCKNAEYRIKPKEEIHRFRVALLHDTFTYCTTTADNEEEEENLERDPWFIDWLGGWQTFKRETRE